MSFKLLTVAPVVICLAALSSVAKSDPNIAIIASPTVAATDAALVGPGASDPKSVSTDSAASETAKPSGTASDEQKPDDTTLVTVKLPKDAGKTPLTSKKKPHKKPTKRFDTSVLVSAQVGGYSQAQFDRAGRVAVDALSYRGAPYVWGGDGRGGVFDCSGFTQYLYAKKGVKLPHSAKLQFAMGKAVDKSELKEGDLVFFNTARGPLTHVGMYIGDGKFIHAANPRRGVVTNALDGAYYGSHFAGARRYTS